VRALFFLLLAWADGRADWWGLEVVLPPPSLAYLAHAPSIAHAVINFLTAMSVANNGVAEILPFVRYISQYVDFEWGTIRDTDAGKGVVCAATWIMPAAMVPRAWDFADPPAPVAAAAVEGAPAASEAAPVPAASVPSSTPTPIEPAPPAPPVQAKAHPDQHTTQPAPAVATAIHV
jgi:hypothetical protein